MWYAKQIKNIMYSETVNNNYSIRFVLLLNFLLLLLLLHLVPFLL